MTKKVGFFSGSFNPIHNGHIAIAEYMLDEGGLDEIWLSVSPLNPLKKSTDLLDDYHRIEMVKLGIAQNPHIKYCDVEMHLPRPSYTIKTLEQLSAQYPDIELHLLIGADNWLIFDQWKSFNKIIENYKIDIYPRCGYEIKKHSLPTNVRATDAPQINVSSTEIRHRISIGKTPEEHIPRNVFQYIEENQLYR